MTQKTALSGLSWENRAIIAIETALKTCQPIPYDQLAQAAEIPSPHRIHKLTLWLEGLLAEDASKNRPLRATIVVSKLYDKPAKGFFDKAKALGLIEKNISEAEILQWYKQQRVLACKTQK